MILEVGSFQFRKSEDGWLFKAGDPKKLKKKYHDLPRFNAQLDLEKTFKEDLFRKVSISTKKIAKLLVDKKITK